MFKIILKIRKLLNQELKYKLILILLLGLLNSLVEVLSLLILQPSIQLLISNKKKSEFKYFVYFENYCNIKITNNIYFYITIVLILIFFLKLIVSYIFNWVQSVFTSNFINDVSNKLFYNYLNSDYIYFLNNKTSKHVTILTNEVEGLNNLIQSVVFIFLESTIIISVFIALLNLEPFGTLLVTTFILFSVYIFNFVQKKYLNHLSSKKYKIIENRNNIIIHSFKNIKDIKIFGVENYFIDQYSNVIKIENRFKKKIAFILNTPRSYLELIIITTVFILFYFLNHKYENNIILITPIFTIYIFALFRILPSINKLLNSFLQIKNNKHGFEIIYNDLESHEPINTQINNKSLLFNHTFKMINLSFKYNKLQVFNNLNFEFNKGDKIGIIGMSGMGKTTLIDLILGLLNPQNGKIEIDGCDLKQNVKSWQNNIGYVQQNVNLFDFSIKENITLGASSELIDYKLLNRVLVTSNLINLIKSLPMGIDTIIGENGVNLSGGQRQRISIARALYKKPEILILDEATSSLDEENENQIINSIYLLYPNSTIIIVSHRKSILKNCNKIYNFKKNHLELVKQL